jgi:hypothetical protein
VKSLEYRLEALKKILLQAYHEKEKLELGDQWHTKVMDRVRKLGPLSSGPDPLMQFGQFVWRLTPVTCLLIIMSLAVLLKYDFTPGYNVLISFIPEAEEISLAQLLPL